MEKQLLESLQRSYEFEKARAEFYRANRAELATKMRIGLVGLNAASAFGTATLYGSVTASVLFDAGVTTESLVIAFLSFVFGAWLAGWSLNAQYVDAINSEGDATTRAQVRSRAIDGVSLAAGEVTKSALDELGKIPFVRSKHDQLALRLQAAAWGLWGFGIIDLAASVAMHSFSPKLAGVSAAFQHFFQR